MIVDGGGRGQALATKLAPECQELFVSPGNPGNEAFAYGTGIAPTDVVEQLSFAKRNKIDLTVVGADDPLAYGIVDDFQAEGLTIFGPTAAQARIESDRQFAKKLAQNLGVPIGSQAGFTDRAEARRYAQAPERRWPLFVKDNELAQGKGAKRCDSMKDVKRVIGAMSRFVIEDYVEGPEASHHSFCDGKTQLSIPFLVRDHKQIGEGDTGLMTGGMGTVGPLHNYTPEEVAQLGRVFVEPVVRQTGFKGVIFSGLKGVKGHEQNLEWNARFGDPEAQLFLRLMKSDLLPVIMACVEGDLDTLPTPQWDMAQSAVCLVLATQGYPAKPQKGAVIEGIETAATIAGVDVLQAGTAQKVAGLIVNGGRVLNMVATADTLQAALDRAYEAAECILFNGLEPVYRKDIGLTTLIDG